MHSPAVQYSRLMGTLPANQATQYHALLVGPTLAYWLGPKGRRLPSGILCWSNSLWMVAAHPAEEQVCDIKAFLEMRLSALRALLNMTPSALKSSLCLRPV